MLQGLAAVFDQRFYGGFDDFCRAIRAHASGIHDQIIIIRRAPLAVRMRLIIFAANLIGFQDDLARFLLGLIVDAHGALYAQIEIGAEPDLQALFL